MKMRYSLLPARAVSDNRLRPSVLRTLSALCCYTSALGICYPNQITLATLLGVSQPFVAKNMCILREFGYVIDLVPVGIKHPRAYQRGNRYFVPVREGDAIPPLEQQRLDVLSPLRTPPEVIENGGV